MFFNIYTVVIWFFLVGIFLFFTTNEKLIGGLSICFAASILIMRPILRAIKRSSKNQVVVLKAKGDVTGLIRVLEHGRPKERVQAAKALGEMQHAAALPALLTTQKSGNPRVAAAAREASRRIVRFDLKVAQAITELEHHDPKDREKAAKALGRSGHPGALEPLLAILKDRNESVRMAAHNAIKLIVSYDDSQVTDADRQCMELISSFSTKEMNNAKKAIQNDNEVNSKQFADSLAQSVIDEDFNNVFILLKLTNIRCLACGGYGKAELIQNKYFVCPKCGAKWLTLEVRG